MLAEMARPALRHNNPEARRVAAEFCRHIIDLRDELDKALSASSTCNYNSQVIERRWNQIIHDARDLCIAAGGEFARYGGVIECAGI